MERKYSIAIEAHGDHAVDILPKISAVVRVDEDGHPQITELTLSATDGGPIPQTIASNIDFAALADALDHAVSATLRQPTGDSEPTPASAVDSRSSTSTDSANRDSIGASRSKSRPYRRMPDQDAVTEFMQRTQSVGKLAQHYEVPRYTAQAWVDRLRRSGKLEEAKGSRTTTT